MDTLKQRIDQRIEPTYTAWLDLKSRAEGLLDRQPHAPERWHVPGYYRDADGHVQAKQGLQDDANAVYEMALCWRMTARHSAPVLTFTHGGLLEDSQTVI